MENNFFKSIEKKTGVNMNDIFELANSLQNANFKDENTVRGIIKRVSQIANKPVSKELEDKMVQSIVNDGKKLDMNTISKMLNSKKQFILEGCLHKKLYLKRIGLDMQCGIAPIHMFEIILNGYD